MRMLCMFDLPVDTAYERRAYREFRKNLIREGFTMIQYSVYLRTCPNRDYIERLAKRVALFTPKQGHIRLISVTERQYQEMKILVGNYSVNEKRVGSERLIVL